MIELAFVITVTPSEWEDIKTGAIALGRVMRWD